MDRESFIVLTRKFYTSELLRIAENLGATPDDIEVKMALKKGAAGQIELLLYHAGGLAFHLSSRASKADMDDKEVVLRTIDDICSYFGDLGMDEEHQIEVAKELISGPFHDAYVTSYVEWTFGDHEEDTPDQEKKRLFILEKAGRRLLDIPPRLKAKGVLTNLSELPRVLHSDRHGTIAYLALNNIARSVGLSFAGTEQSPEPETSSSVETTRTEDEAEESGRDELFSLRMKRSQWYALLAEIGGVPGLEDLGAPDVPIPPSFWSRLRGRHTGIEWQGTVGQLVVEFEALRQEAFSVAADLLGQPDQRHRTPETDLLLAEFQLKIAVAKLHEPAIHLRRPERARLVKLLVREIWPEEMEFEMAFVRRDSPLNAAGLGVVPAPMLLGLAEAIIGQSPDEEQAIQLVHPCYRLARSTQLVLSHSFGDRSTVEELRPHLPDLVRHLESCPGDKP